MLPILRHVSSKTMGCFPKTLNTNIKLRRFAATPDPLAVSNLVKPRLDYKFIRDNRDLVIKNLKDRNYATLEPTVDEIISLYNQKMDLSNKVHTLQKNRKNLAASRNVEEGRALRNELQAAEHELNQLEENLFARTVKIPNAAHPDVPLNAPKQLKLVGNRREFSFPALDHLTLGKRLDIIDFESAALTTGEKFYYLKNEAALLELGLVNWAVQRLVAKGFIPVITPDLARTEIAEACGFQPRDTSSQVYVVENHNLALVGTAEIPLAGMYANQVIPVEKLPLKMVGVSHCFRTEAGAKGADSKGLYRVHQFTKVEMFAFGTQLMSEELHEEMLKIEEELYSELGLHYQVLDMPADDLGAPAYRKYDIEAWIPSRNCFGEISSTSNCTDYQSRRLNIRYKPSEHEKENKFVHTINGTACAVPRVLLAILENNQQADGTIDIPEALHPFVGLKKIVPHQKHNKN